MIQPPNHPSTESDYSAIRDYERGFREGHLRGYQDGVMRFASGLYHPTNDHRPNWYSQGYNNGYMAGQVAFGSLSDGKGKLVRDHSPGAYAVNVQCIKCGQMVRLSDAVIDPDGPAFRAYYHESCAPAGRQVQRCDREGCPRCQN